MIINEFFFRSVDVVEKRQPAVGVTSRRSVVPRHFTLADGVRWKFPLGEEITDQLTLAFFDVGSVHWNTGYARCKVDYCSIQVNVRAATGSELQHSFRSEGKQHANFAVSLRCLVNHCTLQGRVMEAVLHADPEMCEVKLVLCEASTVWIKNKNHSRWQSCVKIKNKK